LDHFNILISIYRWGQTPLQEAINFKHVKIAAILRRHERAQNVPSILRRLNKTREEDIGTALWKRLIENKFIGKADDKNKLITKV